MKIELKKISIAERMSEETTAFTADVYIDGVKAGYAKNGGYGGPTDYQAYEGKKELIRQAEQYCETLPPIKYPEYGGSPGFEVPMNLENFIDNIIDETLRKKDEEKLRKKLEKKQVNTILWGVPNGRSYFEVKFTVPLEKIPLLQLQVYVDKYRAKFKEGEVFLNTNLEKLGVKL